LKNIILIDVDALVASRLDTNNRHYVSPTINELKNSSLNCTNAFSAGNPTEFSLPSLFASSYLLDYGGYENGISNNPITFAEVLKNNGYHTCSFLNTFRPKNNCYDRGFDETYQLWDFQVIVKNLMNVANWYRNEYQKINSVISKETCINKMISYYQEYLDDAISYCEFWNCFSKDSAKLKSSIFDNINFEKLKYEIIEDKKIFLDEKKKYVECFLEKDLEKLGLEKISEKIVLSRFKKLKTTILDIKIKLILMKNIFLMWRRSSNSSSSKTIVGIVLDRLIKGRKNKLSRYQTGEYNIEVLSNWIKERRNKKKPFFVYMKLHDAHEQNIYSHDIQYQNFTKNEPKYISDFFKNIKRDKNYKGNALYDCAINYVDKVINKHLTYLSDQNLIKDTILVITSDHGGYFANLPVRSYSTHRVNSFYDELYKIPMIIYNKDIKPKEYKNLVSSVDLNATLLDLIGIKIPSSFRGKSILRKGSEREYVIFENQGRGPCDLENKPIFVCVRSKFKKIVYEFKKYENKSGQVIQAYNLANDPEEYLNLSKNLDFIKNCKPLILRAKKRIEEILSHQNKS
jgi:arylsulfatase A-like enzyme